MRRKSIGNAIAFALLATLTVGTCAGGVVIACSDTSGQDRRPVPPPLRTAPDPERANNYLNRIRFSGFRVDLDNIDLLRLGGIVCDRYAESETVTIADILPDLYPYTRDQDMSFIIAESAAVDLCEGTGL